MDYNKMQASRTYKNCEPSKEKHMWTATVQEYLIVLLTTENSDYNRSILG